MILTILSIIAIILLAYLFFLLYLVRKLFKGYDGSKPYNYYSKLIATGFTAIIFQQSLANVILKPIVIGIENLTYMSKYVIFGEQYLHSIGKDQPEIAWLGDSYRNFFLYFPLGKLLLAISVAIILYHIIKYLFSSFSNVTTIPPAAAQGENALLYNILILLVLAFSLFLVISVFISIPYLNEIKKPSSFTKNGLDTALNAIKISDTGLLKKNIATSPFPSVSFKDSLSREKDSSTYSHFKRLPEGIQKTIDQIMTSVEEDRKYYENLRIQTVGDINNSIDRYTRDKESNKSKLLQDYARYAQSNAVDKDLLFNTSVDVYRDYIRSFNNNISQAYILLFESDISNAAEYSRLTNRIKNVINSFFVADTLELQAYQTNGISYIQSQFVKYNADFLSNSLNFDISVSVSKKDGSEWGIFGWIAQFLIKTESVDLVLLIGMLGFGLLGASVSSFQRTQPPNGGNNPPVPPVANASFLTMFKTQPIVKDFWGVLARGFSAAILIYLATKGGISILTGSVSSDPNGYILLFLCFIAAVFSEKVWDMAKTKYGL